jgi:A/G-specific adenine glycosylase
MLHTCARVVVAEHGGILPRDYRALLSLPGIGPYTAGAVCAFAYDIPIPVLETNIRTVLFHHFFGTRTAVPDAELMEMSAQLLTGISPRTWYYALMDYGSFLKAQGVRLNSKSKHYTKQSRFEGSDRQVRGAILRCLTKRRAVREPMVVQAVGGAPARVRTQLRALAREGLVRREGGRWTI